LNLHILRYMHLKHARLPIPPPRHEVSLKGLLEKREMYRSFA
jgi:hypothetical protein